MAPTERLAPRNAKPLVALLALCLSGCAVSTMKPATKLEEGETVASVIVDEPGNYVLPRVSAQALRGTGWGDVSGHLGVSPWLLNAGASVRGYAADGLHTELQGNVYWAMDAEYEDVAASLIPRLIAYQRGPGAKFYGGWDAAFIARSLATGDDAPPEFIALSGPIVGVEVPFDGGSSLQLEVAQRPLSYADGELQFSVHDDDDVTPDFLMGVPQVSLGYNFR